jgi:hypothetical protein
MKGGEQCKETLKDYAWKILRSTLSGKPTLHRKLWVYLLGNPKTPQ